MQVILYARADGGVSIVRPVINTHTLVDGQIVPIPEAMTEEAALLRAMTGLPPEVDRNAAYLIDEAAVPADRTFRDAWVLTADALAVDMAKAREIHRNRIRAARAPLLAAADVAYMRALEAGQDTAAIVARKNALRAAPADPAIEAATTPEALAAVWPAVLSEAV